MRKLLFILLVILVSGCAQQGIQEAEPIDSKTDIQADSGIGALVSATSVDAQAARMNNDSKTVNTISFFILYKKRRRYLNLTTNS